MRLEFDWDPVKAQINFKKHGVSFIEAASVFSDSLSVTVPDPDHSLEEDRYVTVRLSNRSRHLIVAHSERDDYIRIISARTLTRAEKEAYERGDEIRT